MAWHWKLAIDFSNNVRVKALIEGATLQKGGDVHEKFDFLENTRFKTLEHLLKAFRHNLAEFTSRERKI